MIGLLKNQLQGRNKKHVAKAVAVAGQQEGPPPKVAPPEQSASLARVVSAAASSSAVQKRLQEISASAAADHQKDSDDDSDNSLLDTSLQRAKEPNQASLSGATSRIEGSRSPRASLTAPISPPSPAHCGSPPLESSQMQQPMRADLLELSMISSIDGTRSPSPDSSTDSYSYSHYDYHHHQILPAFTTVTTTAAAPAAAATGPPVLSSTPSVSCNNNNKASSALPEWTFPKTAIQQSPDQRLVLSPMHSNDNDDNDNNANDGQEDSALDVSQASYHDVLHRALLHNTCTVTPAAVTAVVATNASELDRDNASSCTNAATAMDYVMVRVACVGIGAVPCAAAWSLAFSVWTIAAAATALVWACYIVHVHCQYYQQLPKLRAQHAALQLAVQHWKRTNSHKRSKLMAATAAIKRWERMAGPWETADARVPAAKRLLALVPELRYRQQTALARAVLNAAWTAPQPSGSSTAGALFVWNSRSIQLLELQLLHQIPGVTLNKKLLMQRRWHQQKDLSSMARLQDVLAEVWAGPKSAIFVYDPLVARKKTLPQSGSNSNSSSPKKRKGGRRLGI